MGLARYYTSSDFYHSVFYGSIRDGRYSGPGILLKLKSESRDSLIISKSNYITSSMNEETSVTYIEDWGATDATFGMTKICSGDKEISFKGKFNIE